MSKKSKATILEEQRAKIRQLRLEATNPELKAERLLREQAEAERHTAIAKHKLEQWIIMKQLKGEWESHDKPIDLDDWAEKCSVRGRVSK